MTLIIVVTLALVAFLAPGAQALIVLPSTNVSGPSSLSRTFGAINDDPNNPATVTVQVSDDDFATVVGSVFGQFVADVTIIGAGTVVLSGYVDTTNTLFGTEILIGTADESTVPFIGPLVPLTLTAPYALTLTQTFTLQPLTEISGSFSVSVQPATTVPAPSTSILLSVGLLAAAMTLRRRR